MAMTDILTEQGLSALLALFDADPARAAAHYEALRIRLIRFFAWKGVLTPEDCADGTIDRVARRLAEGEQIRAIEPVRYFHGVARNVLREYRARDEREGRHRALWPRDALAPPPTDPTAAALCLDRCLEELAPAERRMVLEYYRSDEGRIVHRQAMARALGLTAATLRVRMHRLRVRLEACAVRCIGCEAAETFDPSRSPMNEDDEDGGKRG
jgi:DNA-directed RNA polymerase specialized sigma24 family protein